MDPLIGLTVAMSFAALCAGSAAHQLRAWGEWPGIVRNYRLIPPSLVDPAVFAIPLIEALTAAALLWPVTRHVGAVCAAVLLMSFATGLWINIRRGHTSIDCGCLGARVRTGISRWMVVRNVILAILVLTLLLPATTRTLSLFETLVSLVCVLTLAFLYPVLDVILAQAREPASR